MPGSDSVLPVVVYGRPVPAQLKHDRWPALVPDERESQWRTTACIKAPHR